MEGITISAPSGSVALQRSIHVFMQRRCLEEAFEAAKDLLADKLKAEGEYAEDWRVDHQCNRLGVMKIKVPKQVKKDWNDQKRTEEGHWKWSTERCKE